jgi:hypothetical protein
MKKRAGQDRKGATRVAASLSLIPLVVVLLVGGCDSLRFAPSEQQKQNAWLHGRTTSLAAQTARSEETSAQLQALTRLSELQSRSFASYFGLPKEYPAAETTEEVLAESHWQLAGDVLTESAQRPDPWQVADAMLELGIGVCARKSLPATSCSRNKTRPNPRPSKPPTKTNPPPPASSSRS